MDSENKMEGLPNEPRESQPTPDQNLTDEVSNEAPADKPKAQPDTPELPEVKEKHDQLQEPQNSATRDQASDKSDKVEPNKTSNNEQSHRNSFNPDDLLRRDIKRIKSSIDSSFSRLSKKVDKLLDSENKDENKE